MRKCLARSVEELPSLRHKSNDKINLGHVFNRHRFRPRWFICHPAGELEGVVSARLASRKQSIGDFNLNILVIFVY